ncbi:phage tail terminator family protein [Cohnella nanjingensis]|uniref:phage tail terminator family protein n=1 Tax=Cohnella nanjingensis TaxID=1387779 RepID=UPI0028A89E62|nr:hypothetical protein [Cohnella nanjingensis]
MNTVTTNMVRDGVNAVLDAAFPGVEIHGEEIKQGLKEPCFFVKLLDAAADRELGRRYRRILSFDIHYFGRDNREMHDVAEKLYDILDVLNVGVGAFPGMAMKHEIVGRVLHFFVDYTFLVWRQRPDDPVMGTMEQSGGLKP